MMILSEMLVVLLHLTSSCVNIIIILISVLTSAIFFRICNAFMYITMLRENNHNARITNFEKEHYKQDRVNLEDD